MQYETPGGIYLSCLHTSLSLAFMTLRIVKSMALCCLDCPLIYVYLIVSYDWFKAMGLGIEYSKGQSALFVIHRKRHTTSLFHDVTLCTWVDDVSILLYYKISISFHTLSIADFSPQHPTPITKKTGNKLLLQGKEHQKMCGHTLKPPHLMSIWGEIYCAV